MDWKTIGNYVLLVGLFVAMVTMFNQFNNSVGHHAGGDEPTFRHHAGGAELVEACVSSRAALRAWKKKPVLAPKTPSKHAVPLSAVWKLPRVE